MNADNSLVHAMNKNDHAPHTATIAAKTCYEGSVISRAMERAGHNPHLKGHIHEVLVQDLRNISPDNVFAGRVTEMTRSTTAKTVDLVTCKAGKVVERLQLKDTPASIGKVIERVKSGQYRTAQLLGTSETTEAFNSVARAQGLSKTMQSSGISSKTTTALAQRAGATGSGTLGGAMAQAAKGGGAVGAAFGAGVEVVRGIGDLMDGTRNCADVAVSTAKAGVKGGASGAAASVAATATGAAVVSGLSALGVTGAVATATTFAAPVAVAIGVGYMVSEVFDWLTS